MTHFVLPAVYLQMGLWVCFMWRDLADTLQSWDEGKVLNEAYKRLDMVDGFFFSADGLFSTGCQCLKIIAQPFRFAMRNFFSRGYYISGNNTKEGCGGLVTE